MPNTFNFLTNRIFYAIWVIAGFGLWALHILTGFLDRLIDADGGMRSGILAMLDNMTDALLVRPLGHGGASLVLCLMGTGLAWAIIRSGDTDSGEGSGAEVKDEIETVGAADEAAQIISNQNGAKQMSELVWISDMMADPEVSQKVTSDIVENEVDRAIEGQKLLGKGQPVSADYCPNRIWGNEAPDEDYFKVITEVPDLFVANGHYIVSEKAADILRQFDLGGGALHHVREGVFQNDNQTRIPGEYYCWIFGNVKNALRGDESANLREFAPGYDGWWKMPFVLKDDDIAVSKDVLAGPDVWMDPTLFKSIFLSGPLGQALSDAGLAKAFCLKKCRVL